MREQNLRIVVVSLALAAVGGLVSACAKDGTPEVAGETAAVETPQVAFAAPEEAVQSFAEGIRTWDRERAEQLFGTDGIEMLRSGDEVADHNAAEQILAEIQEKVAFEDGPDGTKVAVFGNEAWPFPVPLVHSDDGWRFDVEAGWEEIENRRVGRNELLTLATLHEFVEAQREYASVPRDGKPRAFAQKLFSSEGLHDGLYWPVAEGQPQSPFGPEIAAAAAEGYERKEDGPRPFHGYRFRLLRSQGPSAPGGAKNYLDERGLLTGGFGLVAWPAKYGNSGVKTFIVSHRGVVFEKDLGEETETAVAAIQSFDPDSSWDPARGQ
jgi:hypothetical protein